MGRDRRYDGRLFTGVRTTKVASNSHVDGQLEAGRLFYRQIGGLSAAGDRVDVVGCLAADVVEFDAVAQKRTSQTSIVNLSPLQPVIVAFRCFNRIGHRGG
jgi:hypothetical protein